MPKQPAVLFRRKVYAASPRHKDAIDLAFEVFSPHQRHRICNRIAEGKEDIIFGWADADGGGWEPEDEFQGARKIMYGFD